MTKTILSYGAAVLILVLIVVFGVRNARQVEDMPQDVEASVVEGVMSETTTNQTNESMEQQTTMITMNTSMGAIEIELFKELAPKTVENFLTLANNSFYDGTRFHRVIEDFMIQGGDPFSKDTAQIDRWGTGGPGYLFADEIHGENYNLPGTISMANAGPNTNGSQFFINVADNSYLNDKHTVFGKVVSGYDIVEKISLVDVSPGNNRPIQDVVIESIEVK
jgi:cyclophilin family peptidyl-prolyl cis-trans isomerase